MKINVLLLAIFTSLQVFSVEYTVGSGNKYKLTTKSGSTADLSIYISESKFSRLGIEYYFATNSLVKIEMWQQFIFKLVDDGPVVIEAGYVKTKDLEKPESLTDEYLVVNKGVQVNDFLFSKRSEIDRYKIRNEIIEVPAGSVVATRYRKKREGQTVEFWISDEVGAISLVKLVSSNPNNVNHEYSIELESLIKNVKNTIDPNIAVPLSDKGKSVLAKPISKR